MSKNQRTEESEKSINSRTGCLVCGHTLPGRALLEFEGMPASAQDIPDAVQVKDDKGIGLKLYQCETCGLVQFDCQPVEYYRDVIRAGGFTTTMVELRRSQYRHLIRNYSLEGKKIIEVGCGQGEFLSVLSEFPVEAYGVEHRPALVELAREKGLNVSCGFAEEEGTVLGEDGPYDGFLSFNFLEHQPEPGVMLDCIRNNLREGGVGLITVPSLEYILQYDGYYELIRDHIAYYSFESLGYLLRLHGFEVLEEETVNRDTCSVIVRKLPDGAWDKHGAPIRAEGLKLDITAFLNSRKRIREDVGRLADGLKARNKTLAIWGAGHQGFTLAATTCLKERAKYIIDSAPFKQGRFAPASHLPIIGPDDYRADPADAILIVAPGYTEEIAGLIRKNWGKDVEIFFMRSDRLEKMEEDGERSPSP